jgi:hypothetical protein
VVLSTSALRWIYAKGDQRVLRELALDRSDSVYELRTVDLTGRGVSRVEQFGNATPAFLRHDHLEMLPLDDGWSLDYFERRTPPFQ